MNNLVKINSVEHLTAMIKAIVPRSFEKTFGGLSTEEVVAGFMFCVAGLSQTELNTGLAKIQEMGYCPDPAMFAKWCKGLDGFDNSDAIADSYIGKNAALANILAWLDDPKTRITVAQKQAYDAVYHMFRDIHSDYDKNHAYSAFKDQYEFIVQALVSDREPCQYYEPPVTLQAPQNAPQAHVAVSNDRAKEILAGLTGRLYKNPKNAQTMGLTA
ncbi:hypothetical protein LU290_03340 [Moraxella nasibovis]|uniref:hypothetical protein n=1 Tax=Moraxella nasibovis TaxID=2904120 RepID=UPI00240ED0A9|nr:hypothetical protein [Moraxella nasibovis]WFF39270.1 hypothetical protein LU290_03340 [Moraxella nasibovis]